MESETQHDVIKTTCEKCSQEITYLKKDKSYDFSCGHCKCIYRYYYYPRWTAFKPIGVIHEVIRDSEPGNDGLDGCENWGIDG